MQWPVATDGQTLRLTWAALGTIIVAAIVYLSTAQIDLPAEGGADKGEHLLAYAVLTFWWAQLVVERRARCVVAIAAIGLGIVMEFTQSLLPYRSAELADAVASAAGALIGWAAAPPRTPNIVTHLTKVLHR